MKRRFYLSIVSSLLLASCSQKADKPAATTNTTASDSSPLTAPVQYLGAAAKAQQNAVKTVDKASLNQAIQQFNVDHGRNPKDLNELVEQKYIAKTPAAPYGSKIVYDLNSGEVKIVKE